MPLVGFELVLRGVQVSTIVLDAIAKKGNGLYSYYESSVAKRLGWFMNIPFVANEIIGRIGGYAVILGVIIGRIGGYAVILGSVEAIVCHVLVSTRTMREKWIGGNKRNHGGKKKGKEKRPS